MQLILLALLIAGSIVLYRRFVRDARKLSEKSRREERERQSGADGTLIKDPHTGEYRLDQRREE
jgi:membrane protein implicated in regulation of membrane protease activity